MQNKIWEKYIDYADYTDVFQQYGKKYEIEISRPNQSQMNLSLIHICDILFRIVATRKTRYVSDNKKGLGCGLNKGKMCVSAKYCYVTHELRLHQNDRCKRFTLF